MYFAEKNAPIIEHLSKYYRLLIEEAVATLSKAKEEHDFVEQLYVRNMDFSKVDQLVEETVNEIIKKEGF